MKNKKLLIALAVIAVVIVVIIILAAVFSIRNVAIVYHKFGGAQYLPSDGPTADEILSLCKGKSSVFFSKNKLSAQINEKFESWHVIGIIRSSYNTIEIHFVKREAVAKVDIKGTNVYLDAFGYVVENSSESAECVDITSAFIDKNTETSVNSLGSKLQFVDDTNNSRLDSVLQAIIATWQCYVEFGDMTSVLGEKNVFTFSAGGAMTINMPLGSKIIVNSPEKNVSTKLIGAYSAYYNKSQNMQVAGVVITVSDDGKITSGEK